MMSRIICVFLFAGCSLFVPAQDLSLPAPERAGGMPLSEALDSRHSVRSFDAGKEIPVQMLSNLMWSAVGINREDKGMRTNPTAINCQEIDAYLFMRDGVYKYEPAANNLKQVVAGDYRKLVAGPQEFVLSAPVSVVLVADTGKFNGRQSASVMAAMDAGIACQNINLFCAANGLATVPRATMDKDAISGLLGLGEGQMPLLNNPVGYEK